MILNTRDLYTISIISMILFSITFRTIVCDDVCVACDCFFTSAYCTHKALKPPLTDTTNVLSLYIQNSTVTSVFNVKLLLPSLRELHVVDCLLESVNEDALKLLHKLTTLEFTRAEIKNVQQRTFYGNTMLQHIDLSNNKISELHRNVFSKLPNVTVLKLNENKLHNISEGTFLSNPRLETLNISSNHLLSLKPGIFNISDVTNFTPNKSVSLNISNNELLTVEPNTFALCSHVTVLDLSHNQISKLYSEVFFGLASLRELYLNANSLSENITGIYFRLTSLQILDLRDNQIKSIPSDTFKGLSLLSELHISENQIKHLDPHAFRGLPSLRALDVSGNALKEVGAAFGEQAELASLRELRVAGNRLWRVQRGAFKGCPKLLTLDLSGNALSRLSDGAFDGCARMRTLRLRDNALQRLHPRAFSGLVALRELDLGGNFLSALQLAPFAPLERLQSLTVRLEAGSQCECSLFAHLKQRNVALQIEGYGSLTELCARYDELYQDSNYTAIGCPEIRRSLENETRGENSESHEPSRELFREETTTSGCVECASSIGTMETVSLEPTTNRALLCDSGNCSSNGNVTRQALSAGATPGTMQNLSDVQSYSSSEFSISERGQSAKNVTIQPSKYTTTVECESCEQTRQSVVETHTTNTSLQANPEHAGKPITTATVVYSLLGGAGVGVVCATLVCLLQRLYRFCVHQEVGEGRNYEEIRERHVYEEIDGEQPRSTSLPEEMECYSMSDYHGVRCTPQSLSTIYEELVFTPPPLPRRSTLLETENGVL